MTTATQDPPQQETRTQRDQRQEALVKHNLTTVRDLLTKAEAHLAQALPKGIPASYMIRVVLTAVQRTPKLLECDPITLLGAVFQAAQLGLVPDGVLGQAYLVPFKNTKKNRLEVQFIPGYRGLVTLVRRSGELSTIDADVVHEKDQFHYHRGTDPKLEHVPTMDPSPGKITGAYAIARLKDGGYQLKFMNTREVEAIKKRSSGVKSGNQTPWDTDPEWMFKKTVIKQLCKLLPVSTETQRALALDDRAEVGLPQDLGLLAAPETETPTEEDVIEGETIEMPQRQSEQPGNGSPSGGGAPSSTPTSAGETATTATAPTGTAGATSTASAAPPQDRIVKAEKKPRRSGNGFWYLGQTEAQIYVHTFDEKLGMALLEAQQSKQLVVLTLDPPDGQGLRMITAIAAV